MFSKLVNHHIILSHSSLPEKVRLGLGQGPLLLQVYKLEQTPIFYMEYNKLGQEKKFSKMLFPPNLRAQWPQGMVGGGRMKTRRQKDLDSNPTSNNYLLSET